MSNTNRIVPRRIFRPITVTGNPWGKLAKSLSDLNKDIPWGVFRLIIMVSIVGAIMTDVFIAYVLPFHLKYLSFQMLHWWPWKDPVLIDNTTIYVGVSVSILALYLGWRIYRYLSSQMSH